MSLFRGFFNIFAMEETLAKYIDPSTRARIRSRSLRMTSFYGIPLLWPLRIVISARDLSYHSGKMSPSFYHPERSRSACDGVVEGSMYFHCKRNRFNLKLVRGLHPCLRASVVDVIFHDR